MEETFKYHSQRQALEFAAQIIPVPAEYPLKPGLPEDYRECFERLCRLARAVYLDTVSYTHLTLPTTERV